MATLFGVGLVAFEVMDGGANELAGLLVGADGVDGVADHLKGLEGNHDFVVFDVVAYEHEELCSLCWGHCGSFREDRLLPCLYN